MKAIQIEAFGNPAEVVKAVDIPDSEPGIVERPLGGLCRQCQARHVRQPADVRFADAGDCSPIAQRQFRTRPAAHADTL